MNSRHLVFITLVRIESINDRGIYSDLLREFIRKGFKVTVVQPAERRFREKTDLKKDGFVQHLKVRTLNITQTNILEKGVGTFLIEYQFLHAVKKYLDNQKIDLILYSTPPITFGKVIKFLKNKHKSLTYLLLKDIFPQNAVDVGMISQGSFLHRYFRRKEIKLYEISDYIGCMSEKNKEFLLEHNPQIDAKKVEVNPNSIEPLSISVSEDEKKALREKYNLPLDKIIFVYGGNLGKPQGIDFLLETIKENGSIDEAHFLIVGGGTEFNRIQKWFQQTQPKNATLMEGVAKNEYDLLVSSCDVGLIFLDRRFRIPNFPSRLLSYLEAKLPIISATDPNTDLGDIIEEAGCGFKVIAGDTECMRKCIIYLLNPLTREKQSLKGWELLNSSFHVANSYNLIADKL